MASKFLCILLLLSPGVTIGIAWSIFYLPGTTIGIDMGNTYSCVGVYKNGKVDIIPNDQGNKLTPSWVAFTGNETLIGEAAKDQAALNPEHTIFDFKRLIGRKFDDPEVQRAMKVLPYKIVDIDGKPCIQMKMRDGEIKVFSPEEISAMVMQKMKEMSEAHLGKKINVTVLTFPAHFSEGQKQAMKDAATMAGLDVVRMMDEPSAAVYAYRLENEYDTNVLLYDLSDGKLEVSIFNAGGVVEVIGTSGKTHLGEDLSKPLPSSDLFENTIIHVKKVLNEANMNKFNIHEILIVGASTQIPRARRYLRDVFDGKEPRKEISSDQVFAHGAVILGAMLNREIRDDEYDHLCPSLLKTELSLGIETMGGLMNKIIPRDTVCACSKRRTFTTSQDQQTTMSIQVYEGERALAKDCEQLARFNLSGIAPAPRGVPQIEVAFRIDWEDRLHVTAEDKATKRSETITITKFEYRNGIDFDLQRKLMKQKLREAEWFAKEDRMIKERIEAQMKLYTDFPTNNLPNKIKDEENENFEQRVQGRVETVIKKDRERSGTSSADHGLINKIIYMIKQIVWIGYEYGWIVAGNIFTLYVIVYITSIYDLLSVFLDNRLWIICT